MSKWTLFEDMHTEGRTKTPYESIYIESPKLVAVELMEEYFEVFPYASSCECCGEDFHIEEFDSLEVATEQERKNRMLTLKGLLKRRDVLVIYKDGTRNHS